ncbi:MAG: tRNA (adenosine(37)-N6)-dimethylallyltransferase MiaA [Thermodesulfobacteriota bacterium]|nr:tRNA (adenosine(37)-N6)-dimethylallyltransferase MiaA [Thermodesulfobacteriota bacterium]
MCADIVKPKIIVICGPTALGKTSTAINLAGTFNGEIIGADSMQIYRYMDIGTAKPTTDEQACVAHHMIDLVNPDEHFDARNFAEMAHEKIIKLYARGITPFVVGGTGLYIKALVHGLFKAGPSDTHVRKRLQEQARICGPGFFHQRLIRHDPDTAERIHPNDTYRIIRALEVHELTGKTITAFQRKHGFKDNRFRVLKIGLRINREVLYDRINHRVDAMIDSGFLDEVKGLLGMGYSDDLKSMQSIGYRHLVDFIKGRCSWDETMRTLKRDTRRYAKRQLTWFKADPKIVWKEPGQLKEIRQLIKKFLQAE